MLIPNASVQFDARPYCGTYGDDQLRAIIVEHHNSLVLNIEGESAPVGKELRIPLRPSTANIFLPSRAIPQLVPLVEFFRLGEPPQKYIWNGTIALAEQARA
jgi:hypothetical protein